jgi:hypothetical protein
VREVNGSAGSSKGDDRQLDMVEPELLFEAPQNDGNLTVAYRRGQHLDFRRGRSLFVVPKGAAEKYDTAMREEMLLPTTAPTRPPEEEEKSPEEEAIPRSGAELREQMKKRAKDRKNRKILDWPEWAKQIYNEKMAEEEAMAKGERNREGRQIKNAFPRMEEEEPAIVNRTEGVSMEDRKGTKHLPKTENFTWPENTNRAARARDGEHQARKQMEDEKARAIANSERPLAETLAEIEGSANLRRRTEKLDESGVHLAVGPGGEMWPFR